MISTGQMLSICNGICSATQNLLCPMIAAREQGTGLKTQRHPWLAQMWCVPRNFITDLASTRIKHHCYKPHLFHAPANAAFNTGKAKPQESSSKPKMFQENREGSAFFSLLLA